MKSLLGLILIFVSLNSIASDSFSHDKLSIGITPKSLTQAERALKSGESATFEGDICVTKAEEDEHHHQKCLKVPNHKLVFKAYFPDSLHDVSDKLVMTQSKDKRVWRYSFKSDALKTTDLNQFTLTVGTGDKKTNELLSIKAKLEKRIFILKNFKGDYFGSKEHRESHKENLNFINELVAYLEGLVTKIDIALQHNPEILAQIRLPLQVDNIVSAPFYYSSNFRGHKLTLTIPVGLPFEGEKAELSASVINLSDKGFYFPEFVEEVKESKKEKKQDDDKKSYRLSIGMDGKLLVSSLPFDLAFGEMKTVTVNTAKLNPLAINKIRTNIERVPSVPKEKEEHVDVDDMNENVIGSLVYDLPVFEDTIAPVFLNLKPIADSYLNVNPIFEATLADSWGRIDSQTLSVGLTGTTVDGLIINKDITNLFSIVTKNFGPTYSFNGNVPDLAEGDYEVTYKGSDFAGNATTSILKTIHFDKTPPKISLLTLDNALTNNPTFKIDLTVADVSPIETKILQNGKEVYSSKNYSITYNANLVEGVNTFEIQSVDAAGNVAIPAKLNSITLDTIPPVLSNLKPENNSIISFIQFPITASSNEPLKTLVVNGVDTNLTNGASSINYTFDAVREGPVVLKISVLDLAGNQSDYSINAEVLLKVLRPELISVFPDPNDPTHIMVQGTKWAARPGAEISTGVLGLFFTVADSEGRFQFSMPARTDIALVGYDRQLNRTDYAYLKYDIDTTFSGLVNSLDGKPLVGVKVTINSSGQSTLTNEFGAFRIEKPATGDQIVSFDATGISEVDGTTMKVFHKTNVAYTLGNNQLNVISKPVILVPLVIDGNETVVLQNQTATVTSPNVQGFSLDIAANNATFPSGDKVGEISVQKLAVENVNVTPPAYVKPKTVYALEPSGLKFTEPAKLTLPNDNDFPPNTQLVLMSKNSETGIWEIDGLAKVSLDGNSVETVAGGGITHFSEVFAAPIAPKLSEFNADATNGAVINNNGSKAAVSLPSVKIMGENLSPSLVYNSAWANPKMIVSNIISVDKQERTIARNPNGVTRINGTKVEIEFSGKTWVEPDKVYAWAATGDVASSKYLFSGVPNNSLISYALDLTSLHSGYHSYLSQYEIQLKQMTVGTVYATPKGGVAGLFGDTVTSPYEDSHVIEELYPQALPGNIIVQNKVNSSEGRGWKLGLTKGILDVNGAVLSVENEDGSVKTYHANNNISTIYTDTVNTPTSISSVHSGSKISLASSNGLVKDINLNNGSVTSETTLQSYSGTIGYNYLQYDGSYSCGWSTCSRYRCYNWQTSYTQYRHLTSLFKKADGSYVGSDINGAIFNLTSNATNLIAGYVTSMSSGSSGYKDSVCGSTAMSCYSNTYLGRYDTPGCGAPPGSTGLKISTGFSDGVATSSQFNKITDVVEGAGSSLLIVDNGNNRIRAFNQSANTIYTFAGNGQNYDSGDGKLATQASFFHPQGIATDSAGNVYVSTENGYIRKIDSNGYVTTIAGLPVTLGGKVVLSGFAKQMALVRPYGMVVDNSKNTLYVADSGNNRILAINLRSLSAYVVAGDGTCSPTMKDNIPATSASLCNPEKLALDGSGNLIIFDKGHKSIRKVIFNSNINQKMAYFTLDKDGSVLEKNLDKTFSLKSRNQTTTNFSAKGKQIETISRSGILFEYIYNVNNQLESVLFEGKNVFTLTYNGDYLASLTDKAGKTTYFNIDYELLTSVNFPDGTTESYTYDTQGRILTFKDKLNRISSYEYNEYGELIRATNAKGAVVGKGYGQSKVVGGSNANPTPLTDFNDPTLKDYVSDPKGNSIELKKDFKGYVNTIVDQRGLKTIIDRDADGRPLKVTRPDNTFVQFTYDPAYNDLVKKFDSGTNTTLDFNYDSYGDLISTLENGVVMKENLYDNTTGLLLSETNKQLNQTISYNYQNLGLVSKKIFPNGESVLFDYDEWGNLITSTGVRGETTNLARDNAGNVLQITNPLAQITKREYDVFNRLKSVTTSMLEKTDYEYSLTGQLTKIVDPNGKMTSFIYDELDQLVEKHTPDGQVTGLTYDNNGNVIGESDSSGRTISYEYNKINKVTKKILPDDTYQFDYDIRGNITTAKNDATQVNFLYKHLESGDVVTQSESFGRGFFTSLPSSTLNFEYDLHGNRTKLIDRGQVTSYIFDAGDRLKQITNHKGENFNFDYDAKNRITSLARPGSTTAFDFYGNDMLKAIAHSNATGVISSFDYVINDLGNITSITTKNGTHGFTYDNNNQLTSATNPETQINELYTYDSLGNRVTDHTGNYVYNDSKQKLTEDPRHSFVYDLRGNMIQKLEKLTGRVHKFTYNSEDKLIKYELFDQANNLVKEARYTYDVLGRRIEKIVKDYNTNKTITRRFVYDGQEVLLDLDENNDVLAKFTHSTLRTDDVLSADVTDIGEQKGYALKGSYQYLKDHLGSVIDVADNAGNIVQHFAYSSFGEIKKITDKAGNLLSSPVIENHFAYTGREYDDESNLYYYRARMYDPALGRFLTVDPNPGNPKYPLGFLSKYTYVENNPARLIDPKGEWVMLAMFAVTAVLGAATNFQTLWNGGQRNVLDLFMGSLVGAATSVGSFASGVYGGPFAGFVGTSFFGWLNGGALGTFSKDHKWDSRSSQVGLMNGALSGGFSYALNSFAGPILNAKALEGFDFFIGNATGIMKSYGDRAQEQKYKEEFECHYYHMCAQAGK